MGPRRRSAWRALAGCAAGAMLLAGALPAGGAWADSLGSAQARAAVLLAKERAVATRAQAAAQRYDAALAGLGATVTRNILTQRAAQVAADEAAAARAALRSRIAALYMDGGQLGLYATVLDSSSLADLSERIMDVQRLVQLGAGASAAAARSSGQAQRAAGAAATKVLVTVRTVRSVQQVADAMDALLAQAQSLLAAAQAQVGDIEAVQQAQAALAAQQQAISALTQQAIAHLQPLPASPAYMALYHAAATTCPGLSWTVLAAIGQVESGHGRDTSTSSAGAMGPMQFLPSTFAQYAVDADGDGVASIMSPADAIYTAARYLCANGAGVAATLPDAIFAYNHADWYVQMVLTLAKDYAAGG